MINGRNTEKLSLKMIFFPGKQKDFFTRSWGEDFNENKPIPSSPFVCQLPENTFEKYLKKLRRHCPRHTLKVVSDQVRKLANKLT
jgi:hypothetical protein